MVSGRIIKELNRMYGEFNYRCRLQDISDEKFTAVYKQIKPTSWFDLEDYFYKSTSDKEVHAHLKGFDSYAERQEMVAHIKRLQNECAGGM